MVIKQQKHWLKEAAVPLSETSVLNEALHYLLNWHNSLLLMPLRLTKEETRVLTVLTILIALGFIGFLIF